MLFADNFLCLLLISLTGITPSTADYRPQNDNRFCYSLPTLKSPPKRAKGDTPCTTTTPSYCCAANWDCYQGYCVQDGDLDHPRQGSCTDVTGVCPLWCPLGSLTIPLLKSLSRFFLAN